MSDLYKSRKTEGSAVVTLLQAEVSMEENEELKKDLYKLAESDVSSILINLSQIVFVSSILLSTLVALLKKSKELGKVICLCSLRTPVKQVFKITGIIRLFDIYDAEEKALNSLKSKKA